jgi:hypothetical protein
LIPGKHQVVAQAGPAFYMTVTPAHELQFDPVLGPYLEARGSTLFVHGKDVSVDARATAYASFSIAGVPGAHSSQQLQAFRLVPGKHRLSLAGGPSYEFTVDTAGHVDYAPALDSVLDGRGSITLVVRR